MERGKFPRDNADWLNWIQQGKMLYVNKEKVQNLITEQRTNLAEVSHLDLNFITKVVKNFENPKFSMENVNIMDDYFDETKQDSLQSRQCKARLEQAGIGTGSRFRVDRLCDFNDMEVKDIDLANGKMTFFHPTTHPDYQGEFERSIDRVLENIRMNQGSRWVQVDNDRKDIVIPAARQAVLDRAKDLSSHAAFSDSQVKSLERYCTLYSEKISKERILSSLVGDMGIVLREAGVSKDRIDDVLDELKQLAHDNRREKGKALENAWIFKRQDGDSYKTEQLLVQQASQASFRRPIQNLILSQRYSIISKIQRTWTKNSSLMTMRKTRRISSQDARIRIRSSRNTMRKSWRTAGRKTMV